MIVILAPTAQLASDTLRLSPPPQLSVNAEYGGFVLEGSEYTSAYRQPLGSPYVGRHITPTGKPAPCNDNEIPLLEEHDVALISDLSISTLGGLMRAANMYEDNSIFWGYVEHVDTHGLHKADQNHAYWTIYNGVIAWINENQPKIDLSRNNDVTDFCYEAFNFILDTLTDGHLAYRMGKAQIYLQKKLDETSFVEERPCGLVVRKTKGEDVNHFYREGKAVISYNVSKKSIKISTSDVINNFSCERLVQEWWGDRVKGNATSASSEKGRLMSESDFKEAIEKFENALIRADL